MKRRIILLIPFLGKLIVRYQTAVQMVADEWGDSYEEAVTHIDMNAGLIKAPEPKPFDGKPFAVEVEWNREFFEIDREIAARHEKG